MSRKPYFTDVCDEEWSYAAPCLTLMETSVPQRQYSLRGVFNAMGWIVRAGAPLRMLPNDFPPWKAVYQQSRGWVQAGCFEAMVSDLRSVIRVAQRRQGQPSAVVLDGRTLQSKYECGPRAGYDRYKRKRGSKVHMAVDTPGHLLAVHMTPADEQQRASPSFMPCRSASDGWEGQAGVADQGYTGENGQQATQTHGIDLQIVKMAEAKKGFVLLPRLWVVEHSFGWLARFRRLTRDYEHLPPALSGLHFLVFAILMLPAAAKVLAAVGSSQHALDT